MFIQTVFTFALLASNIECAPTTAPTPTTRGSVVARRQKGLQRRAGTPLVSSNHVVIDYSLGGQVIPISVDTGAWDTWLVSTLDHNAAETSGLPVLYNPNISSTYHDETDPNNANWHCDGRGAHCNYGRDNLVVAGISAPDFSFGLADQVNQGGLH